MADIDANLGLLYAERAQMQIVCQTAHQRLIQLFVADSAPAPLQSTTVVQDPTVLRRQIASASQSRQKGILKDQLQLVLTELQHAVDHQVCERVFQLDNLKILAMLYSRRKLESWLYQNRAEHIVLSLT